MKKKLILIMLILTAGMALCQAQDSGKKVPRKEINALVTTTSSRASIWDGS